MRKHLGIAVCISLLCLVPIPASNGYEAKCPKPLKRVVRISPNACSFGASPEDQAKCLLRKVKMYGNLEKAPLDQLPVPLDALVAKPVSITKDALKRFLTSKNIDEKALGGLLNQPLSKNRRGETAKYFVIHDTSSLLTGKTFPDGINSASWSGNKMAGFIHPKKKDGTADRVKAHLFINRLGQSATGVDFATPWVTTKYELEDAAHRVGLFLGVELIQPRLNDAHEIDAIAPQPGFPDAQLDRLGLVYIAASVRKGEWLIPVFHGAVDQGLCNAHDDPQNFDLARWATRLEGLLKDINNGVSTDIRAPQLLAVQSPGDTLENLKRFALPEPADLSHRIVLWATNYNVHVGADRSDGIPLLDKAARPLGPRLSKQDWCTAAMEGTIFIKRMDGPTETYNVSTFARQQQVDCADVYPAFAKRNPQAAGRLGKTLFDLTQAPFGLGAQNMQLIPFRTLAVDPQVIPLRSVVYIPAARGQVVTLPSGERITHDGYFFAADTGGDIKQNHIDVFRGIFPANPFPNFIKSKPDKTFEAFILSDATLTQSFKRLHTLSQSVSITTSSR